MIILLDVGNTSVTYGLYGSGRLHFFGASPCKDIPLLVRKWSKSGRLEPFNQLVISSVVPRNTAFLKKSLRRNHGLDIFVIGENLKVSIPHKYHSLKMLGQDRLVNLYGALRIYRPPLLILDFGTAITVDYISKKGIFEGGMIIPGPEVSFQALVNRAARIPSYHKITRKPASFLGRNTRQCLASGILEGFGAMTEGLISRYKARYGKDLRTLLTGGFARKVLPYIKSCEVHDPAHSIKSLLILFKDYQAKKL